VRTLRRALRPVLLCAKTDPAVLSMRRMQLSIALAAVGLALVPGLAIAQTTAQDRAFTQGPVQSGPWTLELDARSDPLGGNPSGTFRWTAGSVNVFGAVECMGVVDNAAFIRGRLAQAVGPFPAGTPVQFSVQDNGKSGDLTSGLSASSFGFLGAEPCGALPPTDPVDGQIVVEDAQCKVKTKGDKCKVRSP
jgi:hypothetical protein